METDKRSIGTRANLSASMADLGSIVRLNPSYDNAFSLSFIGNKILQLIETPVAEPIVHISASSQPSYSTEVFHHNLAPTKIGNNVFADVMVMPSHKPLLFSRKLSEKPSTGMSAFGLQFTTQIFEFSLNLLDFTTIIKSAVRSNSEIIYADINTKNNMISNASSLDVFSKGKQEESPAFIIHPEQAFFNLPIIKIFPIAIWNVEVERFSLVDSSNRQDISFEPGTSREVISDRCFAYDWLALGSFDHATSLLNTCDCQLGWQSSFSERNIDKWMQPDIVPDFAFPSLIDAELQSSVVNPDCSYNLGINWNFDFGCCNTNHVYIKHSRYIKLSEEWLPKAKVMGILYL